MSDWRGGGGYTRDQTQSWDFAAENLVLRATRP
jgi:hypothetical protein